MSRRASTCACTNAPRAGSAADGYMLVATSTRGGGWAGGGGGGGGVGGGGGGGGGIHPSLKLLPCARARRSGDRAPRLRDLSRRHQGQTGGPGHPGPGRRCGGARTAR